MTVLNTLADRDRLTRDVVILDIFRASNTIIELLHNGAAEVAVVESLERARELKDQYPDWVVLGERGGQKIEGFDGDNSPTGVTDAIIGKTVALTTSGGARCISACPPDRNVVIGSFANAEAALSVVEQTRTEDVSFWAVGQNAETPAAEDLACAEYLDLGPYPDPAVFPEVKVEILKSSGAVRLMKLDQGRDLEFCLSLNIRNVVPVRTDIRDDLSIFKRAGAVMDTKPSAQQGGRDVK